MSRHLCCEKSYREHLNLRLRLTLRYKTFSLSHHVSYFTNKTGINLTEMASCQADLDPIRDKSIQDEYFHHLSHELENLRTNPIYSDVKLTHENEVYPTSKIILAANSKYFSDIFSTKDNDEAILIPDDITSRALKVLLKFCYTGIIDSPKEDPKFVEELLYASAQLKIGLATQYLVTNFASSINFLSRWELAENHNNEQMKADVANSIAKEYSVIKNEPDFFKINLDCLTLVLSSREIENNEHDDVFTSVLEWVSRNEVNHSEIVKALLPFLKVEAVSLDVLEEVEDDYDNLIDESKELRKLILKEIRLRYRKLRKGKSESMQSIVDAGEIRPNFESQVKGLSSKSLVEDVGEKMENLHIKTTENVTPSLIPEINGYKEQHEKHLHELASCSSRETFNGFTETSDSNLEKTAMVFTVKITDRESKIQFYNTQNKTASEVLKVEENINLHYRAAVCQENNIIYFIGGKDFSCEVQSTFYSFDLITRKWQKLPDMSTERWAASSTCSTDFVYVVGGIGVSNHRLCTVECYDRVNKRWEDLPPMNFCRERPGLSELKGQLYVVGGYTIPPNQANKRDLPVETIASCEIYVQKYKHWQIIQTTLPIGREVNDKIYLMAKLASKMYAVRVTSDLGSLLLYEYNPQINFWKKIEIANKEFGRWINLNAVGNNLLYLIDAEGRIFYISKEDEIWQLSEIDSKNGILNGITYGVAYSCAGI